MNSLLEKISSVAQLIQHLQKLKGGTKRLKAREARRLGGALKASLQDKPGQQPLRPPV